MDNILIKQHIQKILILIINEILDDNENGAYKIWETITPDFSFMNQPNCYDNESEEIFLLIDKYFRYRDQSEVAVTRDDLRNCIK